MEEREKTDDGIDCGVTSSRVELKNVELARKVGYLYFLLEDLNEYRNFDEEFARANEKLNKAFSALLSWRTKRRRNEYIGAEMEYIRLKMRYGRTEIGKLEEELSEYEKIIDRKFWNIDDLITIEAFLLLDYVKTIEEAVRLLEKKKQEDN